MSPTINLRVSRSDRSLCTPTVSRRAIQIDHGEIETPDEHVAEVIACQGSTVLDVQHIGQHRGPDRGLLHGLLRGRLRASGWLALGGLMLLAGAGIVASEVARDWDGYRAARERSAAAGLPAPAAPGHGLGGLGFGLALLGLVPFGVGVVRRHDGGLDRYTLGETPEASFPVSAATLPNERELFELVQRHGDRYALHFTSQMRGEIRWAGHRLHLGALVAQGHTIPTPTGHSFLLPDGARARIEHEGITYRVATVARGKVVARTNEADKPFWLYNAGSFAVLGTLLALVHLVPEDALAMTVDEVAAENRFVGYLQQPDLHDDPTPRQPQPAAPRAYDRPSRVLERGSRAGRAPRGPAGAMGRSRSEQPPGLMAHASPRRAIPGLQRDFDPQLESQQVGILGVMSKYSGRILASPTHSAFTTDRSDAKVWDGLAGSTVGATFDVGGLSVHGVGRQGGGNADGTIGLDSVGLIGKQRTGERDDYGDHSIATVRHSPHRKKVPRVRRGPDQIKGPVDKDAIRRTVRAHINEIRHCYNRGLTRDPNLRGRIAVRFSIGPVGKVVRAAVVDNSLGDRDVGTCVSQAVRRWQFPRPSGGGSAMVTYPFSLSPG